MTDILLLSFESGTRCICMVPLRICNSTLCSVYLISTHKTQRMSGQQQINSIHRITCSLSFPTITVYVMPERASLSYSPRLVYSYLNLRPLMFIIPCTFLPSVHTRCTSVLYQPFPVYRSLCICRPNTISTEKDVESLSFSNGIMNKFRFSAWQPAVSSQVLRCFVQSFQACPGM